MTPPFIFRHGWAYLLDVDKFGDLVSKAEIAYKSGNIARAVGFAKKGLGVCAPSQRIALEIFIARGYSALGKFAESDKIYRGLLCEKIYIAPVVMGLFYNSFCGAVPTEKMNLLLVLVKSCLLLP